MSKEIILIPNPITEIRCPICCEIFDGQRGTPEFQVFADKHLNDCKGQRLGDCGCEWERLCDGSTLLCRTADPCPDCAIRFPDGSCARCPGCRECQPPPRSPLALAVEAGAEDARLLHHLEELERCAAPPSTGLSSSEKRLKDLIWSRLDAITRPKR